MSYLTSEEKAIMINTSFKSSKNKTQAELNADNLMNLIDCMEKLNDKINDIELNVRYIHNAIKAQENRSDSSNNGWFIF